MKTVIALFRQFALVIALLGLVGQSAAFAAPPCEFMAKAEMAQSPDMGTMDDCMKGAHQSEKGSQPCKGMTTGCLAMAGCVSLAAFNSTSVVIDWPVFAGQPLIALPKPPLRGRSVPPDLRPPATLN